MVAVQRLISISRAFSEPALFKGQVELSTIVRKAAVTYIELARVHNIAVTTKIEVEPAWAVTHEAAITEVLEALLSNAIKYTPDNGRVEIRLLLDKSGVYQIRIGDSGIGISQENFEKVFQPFYRTAGAHESSRPGTGLGLAFVRAVVDAAGGNVHAEKSRLGGAELVVNLLAAEAAEKMTGD